MSESESTSAVVQTVRVGLAENPYDVVIGPGLLSQIGRELIQRQILEPKAGSVVIITDQTVGPLYAERVKDSVEKAGFTTHLLTIPAGESNKSLTQFAYLQSQLAQKKVTRSGLLLALGGGVVGDLVGFVASTYLRGIRFAQLPTTLLAMVDSSVGGKTGVNLPEGKNLVGAFYQPSAVWADMDTLPSLPEREFASGMGEVIKYAAIQSRTLVNRLVSGVRLEDEDLPEIIARCVKVKAGIVEADERETVGKRVLLNFGHTIGHAIEQATDYDVYAHGEAVSLGMRAAGWLSGEIAGLPEFDLQCLNDALRANHLPTQLEDKVDRDRILAALSNDKKVAGDGSNRWVLLSQLGKAQGDWQVDPALVETAVDRLFTPLL
jgi:3-dehydroquinate synthase